MAFVALVNEKRVLERALRLHGAGETDESLAFVSDLGVSARGAVHCVNGTRIERIAADKYQVKTTSIDDGAVVLAARAYVDASGRLLGTVTVNCFGLGYREYNDQAYLDELFTELQSDLVGERAADYWDVCK